MICTIFKNIFDKEPNYISVDKALQRIASGRSKDRIEEIRKQLSKDRADKLKMNLPCVCFSGRFKERLDEKIISHSGFIVLDFDDVSELRTRQTEIINHDFIYACWVSPRNNGLKALAKIANGDKHREHFQALQDVFPDIDSSGINESRVCFESYDPDIYINKEAKPFTKYKKYTQIGLKEKIGDNQTFRNILKWLSNRGDAFVKGERNIFVFKLASACCRFGIDEEEGAAQILAEISTDNTFSDAEASRAIKSAYKANKNRYGTAIFEKDVLIDRETKGEVKIDETIFDESIRPKDVIFGEDVKDKALHIYDHGYERLLGIGNDLIDDYYKPKEGELTLLSGIGNYGKSTWLMWYLLMRSMLHDERFALFSPESNPAEEFYHDCVEILLSANCTPYNPNGSPNDYRPTKNSYEQAYDWISKRIFFVYPKDVSPTPEYIKERFLELIIKEKIKGCVIDPFNQLANDYGARSDKYLEFLLSDFHRFAQINNQYFIIVAHPKLMRKDADGNYPCPDVMDIADGAMWNNKMDNILVYHRPYHQKDPSSTLCEVHTKKIRRQKTVGKKGIIELDYFRKMRRYLVDGSDIMQKIINNSDINFLKNIQFTQPEFYGSYRDYTEPETEIEEPF